MNARRAKARPGRRRGMTLIECLVYIPLFAAITGIAFMGLWRLWGATGRMSRGADALEAAVRAGERWREDIRGARGAVEAVDGGAGCRIPSDGGPVEWRWQGTTVTRRTARGEARWLVPVVRSEFTAETRGAVTAWHWDVLQPAESPRARLEPWHRFTAVPGGALAARQGGTR